jgi:hypothetical protein
MLLVQPQLLRRTPAVRITHAVQGTITANVGMEGITILLMQPPHVKQS